MSHMSRILLLVLVLLALTHSVAATGELIVTTTETGKVTDYFREYYVTQVEGTIDFYNPNNDTITGGVFVPDFLGMVFLDIQNTTFWDGGRIVIPEVTPFQHVTMPYKIVGITNVDPALPGHSVMYSSFIRGKNEVTADFYGELFKAPFEDPAAGGAPDRRLISVRVENPTELDFIVTTIRVFKTDTRDPNDILQEWSFVNESNPMNLNSGEVFARDFLDKNAFEDEVYWLVTDLNLADIRYVDINNVTRNTEDDLIIPYELLNYTNETDNETNRSQQLFSGIALRKLADKNMVSPGDIVSLSVILNNFDNIVKEYKVVDEIPNGFSVESLGGATVSGDIITYTGTIDPKNAIALKYVLRFVDDTLFGVDYFPPATGTAHGKTAYSNGISFVRQYIPERRVFVQKRLVYLDDDQVKVTIEVRNLGDSEVQNLVLKEFLDVNDLFSQISMPPKDKGLWDIERLGTSETWEVSYVTTEIESLSKMPQIFGVDQSAIMRSLVMQNVMEYGLVFASTHYIEILGIALIFILPIVYHLINKHHGKLKKKNEQPVMQASVPQDQQPPQSP